MLANELVHRLSPDHLTVAEDVSGMPGLCREVAEGGIGFDFRLNMYVPDLWIKYLKEVSDDNWNMGHLTHALTNRRYKEMSIGYCESHDQALVGDKTIAMWLFDAEIYYNMGFNKDKQYSIRVDRGVALHKMIRLLTMTLGGEGYLTFMGNEFAHPEWIDFPRVGNNNSYHYCRRRWDLCDNKELLYYYMKEFEVTMNYWEEKIKWKINLHQYL